MKIQLVLSNTFHRLVNVYVIRARGFGGRIWMNLDLVNIWSHLDNSFCKKQVSYIYRQIGKKIGKYQVSGWFLVIYKCKGCFYYLLTTCLWVVTRQIVKMELVKWNPAENCFLTTYHPSFMVHWWGLVHSGHANHGHNCINAKKLPCSCFFCLLCVIPFIFLNS